MKPESLKEHFKTLVRNNRLTHAYILTSPDSEDLYRLAKEIAGEITPYNEDIHTISAEGLSIKDRSIEALIERLSLKPLMGNRNIAMIRDADTMTARAQNRLLKTLEEPPGNTVMLLLSNNEQNLLPTVRSRCVLFRIADNEDKIITDELSENIVHVVGDALLRGKDYYIIIDALEQVMKSRSSAHAFLDGLENWYRDVLFCRIGIPSKQAPSGIEALSGLLTLELAHKTIANIEMARRELYYHINVGYAIKNMILKTIYEEESI